MTTFELLLYFTMISFLFFGITCLFTPRMRLEFTRFGLNTFHRLITGILQIVGAIGLFLGTYYVKVGIIAAAGLTLLMLAGFLVRLKIKDDVYKSSPALIFLILSAIICYRFFKVL